MNTGYPLIILESPSNSTVFWTNSEIRQWHDTVGYRTIYHIITNKVNDDETSLNMQASAPSNTGPHWTIRGLPGAQTPCKTDSREKMSEHMLSVCWLAPKERDRHWVMDVHFLLSNSPIRLNHSSTEKIKWEEWREPKTGSVMDFPAHRRKHQEWEKKFSPL